MKKTIVLSEIIQNQATINIGCLGSVSEGKSTTVRQLSKSEPHQHQKERERNSTINLGYANFKIWQHPQSRELFTSNGDTEIYQSSDGTNCILVRHISFVDCPGHENFMTTMMSGTGVMDGVLLLIAANAASIPLRQTAEHMAVLERTDISKILVLQNKIDLLHSPGEAKDNCQKIRQYLETTTRAKDAPILPISAQLNINLGHVLHWMVNEFQTPDLQSKVSQPLYLPIIRSFGVNKPGTPSQKLVGGVIGGSIASGYLEKGDFLEIRPGINRVVDTGTGSSQRVWTPLLAKVNSINVGRKHLDYAVSGGLIGVGLSVDSFWTVSNKLVGQIAGHPGKMPPVFSTLKVKIVDYLIKGLHFLDFRKDEIVLVITPNNVIRAKFNYKIKGDLANLELAIPVCIPLKTKIAVARLDGGSTQGNKARSTLAFIGVVRKGVKLDNYFLPPDYEKLVEEIQAKQHREIEILEDISSISAQPIEFEKQTHAPISKLRFPETPDQVSRGPCSFLDQKRKQDESLESYETLLESFPFNQTRELFRIPSPDVITENKKTSISNVAFLLEKIHAYEISLPKSEQTKGCTDHRELFRKFIASELMKQTRYTGAGALLIDGIFQLRKVQSIVQQYVKKFVICPVCSSGKTIFQNNYVVCHNCGGRHFIERLP